MPFGIPLGERLPEHDEHALETHHNATVANMLPACGALFGATVILFVLWDYWIAPGRVALTAPVRIALVLLGSVGYRQHRLRWSAVQRAGFVYATHASAMIVAASLLPNGILLGLAGIAASVFLVPLVALTGAAFVRILLVPSLLLLVLGAASLSPYGLINSALLYGFAVALAAAIMVVVGAFRRQAFRSEQRLLHNARHDSLTGAANRGYLAELGQRAVALARRHTHPLAVAMIDIDHFKRVNDLYGHATGDNVLRHLVKTCMGSLREADLLGRFGGEEFVCIMPETGAEEAMACAERMRRSVETQRVDSGKGTLSFTISIGVAVLHPATGDWESLLKDADDALYLAKGSGRNRSILSAASAHGAAAS
ncbi:GGDEF domain-containing protein [Massilia solisilvae]|uniref:diguanylate cyclase n=1 Tax=Massilia solisilvae TaxID=1811225 RepID=A0ABT2BGN7_9BURK|nr:GGDEF domain-containing protein [Massilia solisilvae]MCS0607682.1 GGDEF domain-containing protein [Massilia solisilvae]